ncbi:MAG: YbbR-like domain-containing protein [Exilispira sp.]
MFRDNNLRVKQLFYQLLKDIKEHPIPFLISLLLSFMLFYYITNIGIQSLLTVGELQYRLKSNDLFIINKKNIKIKITLRGKPDDLKLVNEDIIKAYIDIDATKPGDYTYKVIVDKSYLPDNIKVVKSDPSYIKVSLDKTFKKKVKIEPNITGKCEKGYSVARITFTKGQYILLEGPYSILSKIDYIKTSEISVDGLNFPLTVPVKLENEFLKIISPVDNQIIIDIRPTSVLKVIDDIAILLANKNNKYDYTLSTNKFSANLLLIEEDQDKISSSDLIFVIDCKYFTSIGTYTIKIIPKTNSGINILNTNPEFVQLTITNNENYNDD